jgi:hypothetical protein
MHPPSLRSHCTQYAPPFPPLTRLSPQVLYLPLDTLLGGTAPADAFARSSPLAQEQQKLNPTGALHVATALANSLTIALRLEGKGNNGSSSGAKLKGSE